MGDTLAGMLRGAWCRLVRRAMLARRRLVTDLPIHDPFMIWSSRGGVSAGGDVVAAVAAGCAWPADFKLCAKRG